MLLLIGRHTTTYIRQHSYSLTWNFFAIVLTLKVLRYFDRCRGGAWTRAVLAAAASSDVAPAAAAWVFASANRDLTLELCRFCSQRRRLDRVLERLAGAMLRGDLGTAFRRLRRALLARVSLPSLSDHSLVGAAST